MWIRRLKERKNGFGIRGIGYRKERENSNGENGRECENGGRDERMKE